MRFNGIFLVILSACVTNVMASQDLTAVHEWGTFTSVAGDDGNAMSWEPLSGPSDLPCFVHHLDQQNLKVAEWGMVRMETPILYFYPLKPMSVSVHVDFPDGRLTEWYPQASSVQPFSSRVGWIEWDDIHLSSSKQPLLKRSEVSHYYAARETAASPLSVENENEKFLFYRGIADFSVDLKAIVHADSVSLTNNGAEIIPDVILFENRAGKVRYRVIRRLGDSANIDFSSLGGTLDTLRHDLAGELVEMGLYRDEAHAMLETWRDSWFEEGLRVFYILPRSRVDTLLPISIQPPAAQLARVFVGRVELLSPAMRTEISAALTTGDTAALAKYGRFLNAFLREMSDGNVEPPMCERARQFLNKSYAQVRAESLKKIACAN